MGYKLLSLFLVLIITLQSKSQTWLWTQRITDSLINQYADNNHQTKMGAPVIATDNEENIIVAFGILFRSTSPAVDSFAIRIAKYDKNARPIWIKYFKNPAQFNIGSTKTHVFDMKLDRFGNIYMMMGNYTSFQNITLIDGNTQNCLVKIDSRGRLIWKKQVGTTESSPAVPAFAQIALSNTGTHCYVYIEQVLPTLLFLDSNFVKTPGQNRMILCRIDSSGRLVDSRKIEGVTVGGYHWTFDINNNEELLLGGTAYTDIQLADTTIPFQIYNPTKKSFITSFKGSDLSRKWTKIVEVPLLNSLVDFVVTAGKFSDNGNIALLIEAAKTESDPQVNKQISYDGQTITLSVPNRWENPFIFLTGPTGNLISSTALSPESRTIVRGTKIGTDRQNNFYASGAIAHFANGFDRFRPIFFKVNSANTRQWATKIFGLDSNLVNTPPIAAQTDYPVIVATIGYAPVPIFGDDTLSLPNCTFCAFGTISALGGNSNVVRGTVYLDYNKNGQQDGLDDAMKNAQVTANNGTYNSFTDNSGKYILITGTGNYTVSVPTRPRFYGSNPSSYPISFTGFGSSVDNKNFALTPDTLVNDVSIDITQFGPTRRGSKTHLLITYKNKGTIPVSGSYSLKLVDPDISFVQSDSVPVFTSTDSIRWNYVNLKPEEQRANFVTLEISQVATSTKRFAGFISPYDIDTVKDDNVDTAALTVTGSYDPNDKLVFPTHDMRIDSIQTSKKVLEYTIRFQNTGTDTAFWVHIADTLSSQLDFSKIRLISSSHPVSLEWKDPNILHFYFRNIVLPDSNHNEPRSHGFAKFEIRPKTSLTIADTIYNKSSIYFDFNPPVVTNQTKTQFRSNIVTSVPNINLDKHSMHVNPNPTKNELNYSICCMQFGEKVDLTILDVNGKKIYSQTIQALSQKISGTITLRNIPAGIYILHADTKKGRGLIKFVKLQ